MADEGHNSELTPKERQALMVVHLQKQAEIDAKIKPLQEQEAKAMQVQMERRNAARADDVGETDATPEMSEAA